MKGTSLFWLGRNSKNETTNVGHSVFSLAMRAYASSVLAITKQARKRCALPGKLPFLAVFAILLASPGIAWGQQVTAAITGKVTDPSGANIPGITVTAKDLERGTVFSTLTNDDGFYNLPRVPIGRYEIKVEAPGFKTALHPLIVLELNQTARVDFALELGEVTQTVSVTSAPPLLNTDTMQVGTIIDTTVNEALPLASRNYIQLTLLAPGTTNPDPSSMKN